MVEIHDLTKHYDTKNILRNVNLEIRSREITAIIGPNASGKSTLLKCILGLVLPSQGTIMVNGDSVRAGWQYRKLIGYMPQSVKFPENLSANELILLVTKIRMQNPVKREELIGYFGLDPFLNVPVRTLSGGTRQKLNAAIAMMYDPQILVLDEPTAGLDPLASSRLKDWILGDKVRGKTALLTSHHVGDLEDLCDRIVFLLEGSVRFDGSPDELKKASGEQRLERAIARLMEAK